MKYPRPFKDTEFLRIHELAGQIEFFLIDHEEGLSIGAYVSVNAYKMASNVTGKNLPELVGMLQEFLDKGDGK